MMCVVERERCDCIGLGVVFRLTNAQSSARSLYNLLQCVMISLTYRWGGFSSTQCVSNKKVNLFKKVKSWQHLPARMCNELQIRVRSGPVQRPPMAIMRATRPMKVPSIKQGVAYLQPTTKIDFYIKSFKKWNDEKWKKTWVCWGNRACIPRFSIDGNSDQSTAASWCTRAERTANSAKLFKILKQKNKNWKLLNM